MAHAVGDDEKDVTMNSLRVRDDFAISQHEGVLEVVCRPGVLIGTGELDVLANTVTHFPNWRRAPMIVHLGRISRITPPARQMLLAYHHLGPIALTGADPVDRVLAAFITQSPSCTRYFVDTGEARTWLSSIAVDSAPVALAI